MGCVCLCMCMCVCEYKHWPVLYTLTMSWTVHVKCIVGSEREGRKRKKKRKNHIRMKSMWVLCVRFDDIHSVFTSSMIPCGGQSPSLPNHSFYLLFHTFFFLSLFQFKCFCILRLFIPWTVNLNHRIKVAQIEKNVSFCFVFLWSDINNSHTHVSQANKKQIAQNSARAYFSRSDYSYVLFFLHLGLGWIQNAFLCIIYQISNSKFRTLES